MSVGAALPPSAADPLSAAADRFAGDVARLLPAAFETRAIAIAIAVSGGPDSMAMLALAHRAFPDRVIAATVDHRLRDDSAEEAAMVARHCATLGIMHATLLPDDPIAGASLQAQARTARYALLTRWAVGEGAVALATAHHADDQAETFLMRAARGSGLSGLSAVRAQQVRGDMTLIRPLLDWRRAELRSIARRSGTPFVDDPANLDDRHDRTRFRRLLEANAWLDPPHIARAAAHLAEAEAAIDAMLDWLWRTRTHSDASGVTIDMASLPRELIRRLARRAIAQVAPGRADAAIEPLLDAVAAGKRATQAAVMVSRRDSVWRFREAPPRRAHRST